MTEENGVASPEIEPIFARVVLERPLEKQTAGGIIIPETSQKNRAAPIGVVVAVGNGCDEFMNTLIGKTVMFARFAGDWLKIPGTEKEYYICQEEDVLGIIKEAA